MPEARKRVQTWDVTDELWSIAAPLVPERKRRSRKKKYARKAGGGRKRLDPRRVFEGI